MSTVKIPAAILGKKRQSSGAANKKSDKSTPASRDKHNIIMVGE